MTPVISTTTQAAHVNLSQCPHAPVDRLWPIAGVKAAREQVRFKSGGCPLNARSLQRRRPKWEYYER